MTNPKKRARPGLNVERVWITIEQLEACLIFRERPTQCREAFEYMRVMSRDEVEKLASDGVDTQQMLNSLMRTVEGQRRDINRLKEKLTALKETP